MAPVIESNQVTRHYGAVEVLRGISLSIEPGQWVSLVGPSGCGKTTLLQILGLLDRPTSGDVRVVGDDGWSRSASWRATARLQRIGFVFQAHNLLGHLTARDNVALPAWRLGGSRQKALTAADQALDRLGLADRAATLARVLSMGEAQRVAIARALINQPAIVLADEPTGSLDSASADTVLDALGQITEAGTALLLVTHDRDIAARAQRTLSMRDGELTSDG